MKRSSFALSCLILVLSQVTGQTPCDVRDQYENFISIGRALHNGHAFLSKGVIESNSGGCMEPLVQNSSAFIDYLLTNFSSRSKDQSLLQIEDSLSLRKAYFASLRNDSLFNSTMADLVGKTINGSLAKDSVSMDQLLDVAVKYFSIIRITPEGYYVGKVCAGINGIKSTMVRRKPFVEAFAFASILKHYNDDEYSMYEAFAQAIKDLYTVDLGVDQADRLLRAQGGMYLLMKNNVQLRDMLLMEYGKQTEFLPFVLTGR